MKPLVFLRFAWSVGMVLSLPFGLWGQLQQEHLVFEGLGKPFLDNVSAIDLSPDGRQLYCTSFDDAALTVFDRNPNSGELTLLETHKNEVDGVMGLSGSYAVKVSPDGRHVYATGQFDHALVVFSRHPSDGNLTYEGLYQDGEAGIDGLNTAFSIELSPDGNYLYLIGSGDNAVVVFQRNVLTGMLHVLQVVRDGQAGVENMNFPIDLRLSPDGQQMFVTSFGDNALVVLNRNPETGLLGFATSFPNGVAGVSGLTGAYAIEVSPDGTDVYVTGSDAGSVVHFRRFGNTLVFSAVLQNGVNGISDLDGAAALRFSADGAYLYAAGTGADALLVFERNLTDGDLTLVEKLDKDNNGIGALDFPVAIAMSEDEQRIYVAGFGANALLSFERQPNTGTLTFDYAEQGLNQGISGLQGAQAIGFSPDGTHAYVAGEDADAVTIFSRDQGTGALTFVGKIEDGNGIDGLNGVKAVTVSADGQFVYTAGFWDNSVAVFSRDLLSGELTYLDRYKDGLFGVNGLSGTNTVVLSPDQNHLYASGFWDHGLVLFTRNPANGTLTFETAYLDGTNGINGLENISDVVISIDGQYVYAAGQADQAIAIFSRDTNTGMLSYVGLCQEGVNGVAGLKGVKKLRISPNGLALYALGEEEGTL
ncbi:MAG: beta-propeller fold lactonase family protein, partial [Bacteroidota bacterium]